MAKSKIDVDEDLIRKLADLLDETGLTEIEYGEADIKVRVTKGGSVVAQAAAAPVAAAAPAAVVALKSRSTPANEAVGAGYKMGGLPRKG